MSGLTKGHPVKRRYWPYDELISIPRVRVMRALRRFEWATSEDLTIALDLTSDDKLANNHVVALSRITGRIRTPEGRRSVKKHDEYTITYEPHAMCGENGHNWKIRAKGRLIAEGWSRGKRHHAEADVRETIRNRDALRSAAGLA